MNWLRNISLRILLPGVLVWGSVTLACGAGGAASPNTGAAQPPPAATQVAVPATALPAVPEQRLLTLEWPSRIRVGDSDVVRLALEMDEAGNITPTAQVEGNEIRGAPVQIPNLYETHNVVAEARIDLAGVQVSPQGEIAEPMQPGKTVTFFWSVRPDEVGDYRGTVWLHLHFIPRQGAGEGLQEERLPLTAQVIDIQAVNLFGLGGAPARLVGGAGALVGSVLGLDNVVPWVWNFWKKRRKGRPAGPLA